MSKLIKCKHCNHDCANSAKTCPSCGGKPTDDFSNASGCFIIILVIAGLWYFSQSGNSIGSGASTRPRSKHKTQDSNKIIKKIAKPKPQPKPQPKLINIKIISTIEYFKQLNNYANTFRYAMNNKLPVDEYVKIAWETSLHKYIKSHKIKTDNNISKSLNQLGNDLSLDNTYTTALELQNITDDMINNNQDKINMIQQTYYSLKSKSDRIKLTNKQGEDFTGVIEYIKTNKILLDVGDGVFITLWRKQLTSSSRMKLWHSEAIKKAQAVFIKDLLTTDNLQSFCYNIIGEGAQLRIKQLAKKREQVYKKISHHFSTLDGSHNELVKYVKKQMNNPNSFEHIKTTYYYFSGDNYKVRMIYRGTNVFNAIVSNNITARVDMNNNIIKIIPKSSN